ncbi:amino acid ABC transporter permease [Treponema sp.]|uniref:amino acid ABC transporter permease n=1 Tax=Treponema sp. TaxID=166 RepID=UPI0025F9DE14|nr:amino acid ABC transporter permease [Treponema sp.]MCR5217899.1 amino acid ABC transporter permease [Treponema sp.]
MWRGHELFITSFPSLAEFIPVTIFYLIVPTIISWIIGTLICIVRTGKKNILYYAVSLFVSFFRGTPGLVQLYIVFFGLPELFAIFGVNINAWDAGFFYVVATTANFSSFVSEVLRGAYQAIDKDQIDAGYSIGYSRFECFFKVTVPLTVKIALPNLKNLEIDLLKGSAVAYVIGLVDIMGRASKIISVHRGYGQIWVLLAAAVIYFLLTTLIEYIFNRATRHFSKYEVAVK